MRLTFRFTLLFSIPIIIQTPGNGKPNHEGEELSETEIIAGLVDLGLSYRLLSDKIFFVDFLLVEPVYIYGKVMILC